MTLSLYDTARGSKVPFVPLVAGEVSIYCCGLTVQSAPHLGHIRKEVVFDVLRRWLTVGGLRVTLVTNVTDIDDKILAKSAERGVPWWAHSYTFEGELHKAYAALGLRPPTYEPRATGHIPEMIELVQAILDNGHGYVAADGSGDVYFDVRSWPGYGALSGQRVEEMEPALDADPRGKRDPRDFALWKGYKEGEPLTASWPSPWGRGRPGWHLECSAMAGKYLGDAFDIHGGGIDLKFPHHENELAQSQAAGRGFAQYWLHNAWVTAAGEKMSKSLGNGLNVVEVTERWPARAVRLYLVGPHYRSMIEFSDAALDEAAAGLARVDSFVSRAERVLGAVEVPLLGDGTRVGGPSGDGSCGTSGDGSCGPACGTSGDGSCGPASSDPASSPDGSPATPTPASVGLCTDSGCDMPVEADIIRHSAEGVGDPVDSGVGSSGGAGTWSVPEKFAAAMDDDLGTPAALAVLYDRVREGNRALEAGDSDAVRTALIDVQLMLDVFGLRADAPEWQSAGPDLESVVDGLVSALLEQRAAARTRKDYAAADAIRDQLTALGLTIEDTPTGPRWTR